MFGLFLLCITKHNTYITGTEEKMVGGEEVLVRVVVKENLLYIFCIKGLFVLVTLTSFGFSNSPSSFLSQGLCPLV